MWTFLGFMFVEYGYEETWQLWRVPTERPPFLDFRLIPGSAESFRDGFEPSLENPYDPNRRIFNYPAFWRLFFQTNITQDDTIWMTVSMLVLYFLGVMLFPQGLSPAGAFWTLLVVFSPAAMLLYERGNVDLIVFFLCALIVLAAGYSAYLTTGLILFAAVVKMFPFFGMTVLLREPKRKFILLAIVGVVFVAAYSALTLDSQSAAWNTTMRGGVWSYGSFVLITRFDGLAASLFPGISSSQWKFLFEAFALALILFAALPALWRGDSLPVSHERNLTAFRMGASIYLGTFLLGNNWDYRLAFLVFVIPQMAEWLHLKDRKRLPAVIAVFACILLSCWHFVFQIDPFFLPLADKSDRIAAFDELVNWLLVPGFAYFLAASLPGWLRSDLQKWFGRTSPGTTEA